MWPRKEGGQQGEGRQSRWQAHIGPCGLVLLLVRAMAYALSQVGNHEKIFGRLVTPLNLSFRKITLDAL